MPRMTETRVQEKFAGSELTADEIEFLLAMERYKRERGRPFPTWHEVLSVVKSLGYRKVELKTGHEEHKGVTKITKEEE